MAGAVVNILKNLVKRRETTDTRLDGVVQTQLQLLQLMRLDADQTDDHARRLPAVESHGPRIQRLEDEVFRTDSRALLGCSMNRGDRPTTGR